MTSTKGNRKTNIFYKTEIRQTLFYIHFNLNNLYTSSIPVCNILQYFVVGCLFCLKYCLKVLNIHMIFNFNCIIQMYSINIHSDMYTIFNYFPFYWKQKLVANWGKLILIWKSLNMSDSLSNFKISEIFSSFNIQLKDIQIFNVNVLLESDMISYLAGI